MHDWLRRLRGALGLVAGGAVTFLTLGWAFSLVLAVLTGQLPALGSLLDMSLAFLLNGAVVGGVAAGAIALSAFRGGRVSRLRVFGAGAVIGMPLMMGAVVLTGTPLDLEALLLMGLWGGVLTGGCGIGALAIADRAPGGGVLEVEPSPESIAKGGSRSALSAHSDAESGADTPAS